MVVINYTGEDFELTVSCRSIEELYAKAAKKVENIEMATYYIFPGPAADLKIWSPGNKELISINSDIPAHPIFFENATYRVEIIFTTPVLHPMIYSPLREITEKFHSGKHAKTQHLIGSINYNNDVGYGEFDISYEKDGALKNWSLVFEVFPTKLDLKKDRKTLVDSLEETFRNLTLDILKRTWMNYSHKSGPGSNLTWWSIFESVFQELLESISFILNKPHGKLRNQQELKRIDQIKRIKPAQVEEWIKYREFPEHLYTVDTKVTSYDTLENRFLKHVSIYCWKKSCTITDYLTSKKNKIISPIEIQRLSRITAQFKKIKSHTFFETTGNFSGLVQESAVLQKKAGYSTVYRDWIFLRRSIQLFEGINRIHLKNIANLYQYWCFIKIKLLIQSLLDKLPEGGGGVEVSEIDNFLFSLNRGSTSCIRFQASNGDSIELYHELSYELSTRDHTGSQVYTEIQRPDITLKIIKTKTHRQYLFTYLFDAKYRLEDRDRGPDWPPVDAINQMHRYRDAIYHQNASGITTREIVGAYVLFPGSDALEAVKGSDYFRAIKTINIGAFPLLPDDRNGTEVLLKNHLKEIIFSDAHTLLKKVIPHSGLLYEDTDAVVLFIFPSMPGQSETLQDDGSCIYQVPFLKPDGKPFSIALHGEIKYLAVVREGAFHYSRIKNLEIAEKSENSQPHLYYTFHLSAPTYLVKRIPATTEGNPDFLYTRLSQL